MDEQPQDEQGQQERSDQPQVILTASPTIKPTVALLFLTVAVGVGGSLILGQNPRLLGQVTPAVARGVEILVAVAALGLLGRIYVLTRTSYVVTDAAIRRRFQFLLREKDRKLPLAQVRATELDRSRVQSLFGAGTLRFLTGGTNQSLGFVDFESIANPKEVRSRVEPYVERERGQRSAGGEAVRRRRRE